MNLMNGKVRFSFAWFACYTDNVIQPSKAQIKTLWAFNHYKVTMAQFTNTYDFAIIDALCIPVLFICVLFNNAISTSDYIAWNAFMKYSHSKVILKEKKATVVKCNTKYIMSITIFQKFQSG